MDLSSEWQAAIQLAGAVPVFVLLARLTWLAYQSWTDAIKRAEQDIDDLRTENRLLRAENLELRQQLNGNAPQSPSE